MPCYETRDAVCVLIPLLSRTQSRAIIFPRCSETANIDIERNTRKRTEIQSGNMASQEDPRSDVPDPMTYWRQRIDEWYPDRYSQVHVLPPVHFRKVPYSLTTVCDQPALLVQPQGQEQIHLPSAEIPSAPISSSNDSVADSTSTPWSGRMWSELPEVQSQLKKVQESDIVDDKCQQRVLYCLQQFGKQQKEAMFILSQLNFSDYLNEPSYAATAKQMPQLRLPRPITLGRQYKKGEFDILLIHRHYGILVGEVKSVGHDPKFRSDDHVNKKAEQAVQQMVRSASVLKHLVKDLTTECEIPVRTTLILPCIQRSQLHQVLQSHPKLAKDLSKSLGLSVQDDSRAASLCLCADELDDNSPGTWEPSRVDRWWRARMEQTAGAKISDSTYDDILARFCGPATTVSVYCISPPRLEVRTLGEALSEAGERLSRLVLTPQQVALVASPESRVFVTGPPGTGKSIVLVLKGVQWLMEGEDVHVVSTFSNSLAVSRLIYHQMSLTVKASGKHDVGQPHLHDFQFFEDEGQVQLAVETMVAAAEKERVNILVDEYENGEHEMAKRWHRFVSEVCNRLRNVCLWIASSKCTNLPPDLHKETLTLPLRSAPSVVAEVDRGVRALSNIPDYTCAGIPAPLDGPQVIRLHHYGPDHLEAYLVECEQCGKNIATELQKLKVGTGQANESHVQKRPAPLRYCDVFILVHSYDLGGVSTDDASGANGLVRGLRDAGIPVRVVRDRSRGVVGWDCDVRDTSVARTDKVTVSDWGDVVGTERKVVVWLPGRIPGDDDKLSDEHLDRVGRLWAMSRCIVQLILVDIPTNSQ